MTTLQDEIRQTRPFGTLEEEAGVSIARTAAVVERQVAETLKPYGITPTQYNVLRILRGAGGEGLCRNEVGERMVSLVPDVTRLLDRMEQLGLVSRARGGDDRRFVRSRLTAQGLELVNRLDPVIVGLNAEMVGHLGAERLLALIKLLEDVRNRP